MRLRGIIACLVILGALAIGSGYLAIRNIDVNTYRTLVAAQVEDLTGRPVTIAGDVRLSPSLHPSIVIEQVSFASPAWGTRPQMATVERLELQASLLPLLAGRFEIGRVVLSGVDLFIETDGAGQRNWDFSGTAGQADTTPSQDGSAAPPLPALIGNLVLMDVLVTIRDGASGRSDSFRVDNLSAESDVGRESVAISLDGSINHQPYLVEGTVGGLSQLIGKDPYPVKLAGDIAGASATLEGNIDQSSTPGVQSLDFTISGQNLADLSTLLAIDLPATRPYSLAAIVEGSADSYELRNIALQLGTSDLSGALRIQPRAPRWHIDGTLHATTLNLADLWPAANAPAEASGGIFPDGPLSLAMNGGLDGTIRFSADRLVDPSLMMNTVAFDLALAEGRLDVSAFQGGLAGGSLTGTARLETGANEPQWRLQLRARQVAAGDLLRLLSGSTVLRGGRADLAFDLRSRGRSAPALLAALTGSASVDLNGGILDDDFIKLGLVDAATPGSGRLTCAVARFAIKDGVARSSRLVVDTRDAVVAGDGRVDLRRETIAMRFKPRAKPAASMAGLDAVSFDVTGSLADPEVQPDAPAVPANTGIAALATTGAVVGSIAAVTGTNAPVNLPAEAPPLLSCSSSGADAQRVPENAVPTAGSTQKYPAGQASNSGTNDVPNGAAGVRLTPFGGALAADDGALAAKSSDNVQ